MKAEAVMLAVVLAALAIAYAMCPTCRRRVLSNGQVYAIDPAYDEAGY